MSKEYGNTRDRPGGSLPSVAGIEKRNNKTMAPTWRVLWRENGRRQYELFTDENNATQFRRLVEASGKSVALRLGQRRRVSWRRQSAGARNRDDSAGLGRGCGVAAFEGERQNEG
jgi:hypothetical protein